MAARWQSPLPASGRRRRASAEQTSGRRNHREGRVPSVLCPAESCPAIEIERGGPSGFRRSPQSRSSPLAASRPPETRDGPSRCSRAAAGAAVDDALHSLYRSVGAGLIGDLRAEPYRCSSSKVSGGPGGESVRSEIRETGVRCAFSRAGARRSRTCRYVGDVRQAKNAELAPYRGLQPNGLLRPDLLVHSH